MLLPRDTYFLLVYCTRIILEFPPPVVCSRLTPGGLIMIRTGSTKSLTSTPSTVADTIWPWISPVRLFALQLWTDDDVSGVKSKLVLLFSYTVNVIGMVSLLLNNDSVMKNIIKGICSDRSHERASLKQSNFTFGLGLNIMQPC